MTREERSNLVDAIAQHLDTRDKRYMFLKMMFRDHLPNINIEGSPRSAAFEIVEHFTNQNMDGSLMAHINHFFDTDLTLTYK